MEARKVLVKENDIAIITCPFCRKSKKLLVTQYKEKHKRDLRIKCTCDNIFSLCLEYRKHPRKSVRLLGKSVSLPNHRDPQDIIIKNISLGGIGFCPFKSHRIKKNDRLRVLFELNDACCSLIKTETTVRSAGRDYIGCEFGDMNSFKTALGFYLLA